mmetsp:Transcript_4269/g.14486  ORF Transcript_4269/g.14486 Transcript_4269/m.14486 type:complete len:269 (-) Transcript_4269:1035-1841(-)
MPLASPPLAHRGGEELGPLVGARGEGRADPRPRRLPPQPLRDLDVPRVVRPVGRGALDVPVGVGDGPVAPPLDERLDAVEVVVLGGVVQRGLALLVDVVGVGARSQAEDAALCVPVLRRALERRIPVGLDEVDVGAALDQPLDSPCLARTRRQVDGGGAVVPLAVDGGEPVGALSEQHLGHLEVARHDGGHERRHVPGADRVWLPAVLEQLLRDPRVARAARRLEPVVDLLLRRASQVEDLVAARRRLDLREGGARPRAGDAGADSVV